MKRFMNYILAVVFMLALATSANALTAGFIPSNGTNDFIGPGKLFAGPTIGGWYGAQIYYYGNGEITAEYYGAEAGYKNQFNFNNTELFAHNGGTTASTGPIATVNLIGIASGLLNFSFDYNSESGSVNNGSNPDDSNGPHYPNFFVSFDASQTSGGPTSGQYVWIFLDDGATVDDNHDDMLVKLSITNGGFSVPEPTTMLLLGLGLVGLAGAGRKFKK